MLQKLAGKGAVITGGSSGIGLATVERLSFKAPACSSRAEVKANWIHIGLQHLA